MFFSVDKMCNGLIPTDKQRSNLEKLVYALNIISAPLSKDYSIVYGLMTEENAIAKGFDKNSPLITGEAVVLQDRNFELSYYLINNTELLERHGLYLKNPAMTVSKTSTQQIDGNTYMSNYILLQTRPANLPVFNEG